MLFRVLSRSVLEIGFEKKCCILGIVIKNGSVEYYPKSDVSEFIIEIEIAIVSVSQVLGFVVSNHESSYH